MVPRIAFCLAWAPILAGQTVKLDVSALEASAREELDATKTPGAAIGIVSDGRLVYANGFGTSNIETGAPITTGTLFRLGSTTKMLTAAAAAALVAEGKLHFEDTVGKHIRGLDPAIAALTLNQLLSHTSGLKDVAVVDGRHDDQALGEGVRTWKRDWLFTKPGAIYSYADPNYWLAGFVVESVARKPYAEAMEELVFEPVGMASSTLRPTMAMTRTLSQGHDVVNNKAVVLRPFPDNAASWPSGSVFSNLIDLSRFVMALIEGGKLNGKEALSPKVVKALTTPHADIPGSPSTKYGYGLIVEERGETLEWRHGGSRPGYGSYIAMIPERRAGMIVLCNKTGETLPKTRAGIIEMLGGPPPENPGMTASTIPASEFSKYTGSYRNGNTTMRIFARDGRLLFRSMDLSNGESMDLRSGEGGWLIIESREGRTAGRVFGVRGADGRIEYLFLGNQAAARVM